MGAPSTLVVSGLSLLLIASACGGGPGASTDHLPPTTPNGLVATPASESAVDLEWNPSIDDQGVAAYRVYRDGGLVQSVPGVTARDPAAPSTATICYEVSAVDVAGNESGHSNTACLNLAQAWIPREAGTTMNLTAVAWSGSEFVAVGDAQEILVSADGAFWKPKT